MRVVKYTPTEIIRIKEMLAGVMSFASQGLLQKEGEVIGEEICKNVTKDDSFFNKIAEIIVEKGWAESAQLSENKAVLKNTAETEGVSGSSEPVCHILRGILKKIYENYYEGLVFVNEVQCRAVSGGEDCVFEINAI